MKLFGGKGPLIAAIALGALTSYVAWRYVDQASQQSGQPADMTPVVVANVAIPARTVITPEMVRIQQLPSEAAHVQAAHSVSQVVGKVVKSDLIADEQVLSSRLFLQRGDSGLAFMIPDGMRAVSVGFSEMIGSGGMVVPGDHVDIIGVFDAKGPIASGQQAPNGAPVASQTSEPKADAQTTLATIVLQNVQVLAVAQRVEGEETTKQDQGLQVPGTQQQQTPPQQVRSDPAPQPAAKTATLALSPEDALRMVLAEGKGQIRLALRPANDKTTPNVPQVPMSALLMPAPTNSASPSASAAAPNR
jgi:pilus assembly protein CpaB